MCRRGLCGSGGLRQYEYNGGDEGLSQLEGERGEGTLFTIDIIVPGAIVAYEFHTLRQKLHQLLVKRSRNRRAVVRAVDYLHIIIFTSSKFGEEVGSRPGGILDKREDAAEVLPFWARVHDTPDEESGGFEGHGGGW